MTTTIRILKASFFVLAAIVIVCAVWFPFRGDPIGPLAGQRLSGDEAPWPADWGFTEDIELAAVEVRSEDPHSVTTICFVHDGALHVPASKAAEKQWPQLATDDPRVRIKLVDRIFLGRATRVTDDAELREMIASVASKYASLMPEGGASEEQLAGVWVFRIDPR